MVAFAYAQASGKIPALFDKIHDVGQPTGKVGQGWLQQVGFASSNDRTLLAVLRQVGFIDSSSNASEKWTDYRKATVEARKAVLGRAIQEGYRELYEMYSNAHQRPDGELEAFFRSHVSAGAAVLQKTIQTFKALVSIASFGDVRVARTESKSEQSEFLGVPSHLPPAQLPTANGASLSIAINIQLAVPETKDAEVYAAFFQSMKRHLLA